MSEILRGACHEAARRDQDDTMRMTLDALFDLAAKKKASDVHLAAGKPPHFRIDGELAPVPKLGALDEKLVHELVFSILSREQEERFEKDREYDFAHQTSAGVRFRVNVHFERGNVGLVARLIPKEIPAPSALGLPSQVTGLTDLPHGLVLITGPAGSGKSTTLASLLQSINESRAAHMVTLEDPIEFLFPAGKAIIKQREVGSDTNSFADGLKRVLRQDPNVVMVGEMRDLDTTATTLTLAETGHLVFATLHTYNAAETVARIVDIFPPFQQPQIRTQLALSLRAVISQQLLPKKGGGRVAAREILLMNAAVGNLIRENKIGQIASVIQTSVKQGMVSLAQDLMRLVKSGDVAAAEADRYLSLMGSKIEKEKPS